MMIDYADVCGISKTELLQQLDVDIAYFAERTEHSKEKAIAIMVLKTKDVLYLIELKLGGTADAALQQIETNGYAERFAMSNQLIVRVGVVFDGEKGNIGEWKVAR